MSVQIKLSYESEQELQTVIKLLSPAIKSCRLADEKKGKFKRAYIKLK